MASASYIIYEVNITVENEIASAYKGTESHRSFLKIGSIWPYISMLLTLTLICACYYSLALYSYQRNARIRWV